MTAFCSVDTETMTRSYATSAYLEPNLHRPNLLVVTDVYVTKVSQRLLCATDITSIAITQVTFEEGCGLRRALGVKYICKGASGEISGIQKDVILCTGIAFWYDQELIYMTTCVSEITGSLQTPQVLELSGIGNPTILSKFGIDLVVDLPGVGENLRKCASWLNSTQCYN